MPDNWKIESSKKSTALVVGFCGLLGLTFIALTHAHLHEQSSAQGGFLLGVLFLAIGAATLLFKDSSEILVNGKSRELLVKSRGFLKNSDKVIPFSAVSGVSVRLVTGKDASSYYLQLQLRDGTIQKTGLWSFTQSEVTSVAERLAEDIGCPLTQPWKVYPYTVVHAGVAAAGAVMVYLIWYRGFVGPFCPAMWAGTAPPFIVVVAFFNIITLLKYFQFKI